MAECAACPYGRVRSSPATRSSGNSARAAWARSTWPGIRGCRGFDALKLLRAELCDDPAFVGRFEREADTVAQLDHPNIVAVHDRGSQDGQLWISMRFIDGTNAEKALAEYPNGDAAGARRADRQQGRLRP